MVKHTCPVVLKAQRTQPQGNPLTPASLVTTPPDTTAAHGASVTNLIAASVTTHKHTQSKQE